MPERNSPLNLPLEDFEFSCDDFPAAGGDKREVPPLFLSPREKRRADDLTPPGLSNPFWSR